MRRRSVVELNRWVWEEMERILVRIARKGGFVVRYGLVRRVRTVRGTLCSLSPLCTPSPLCTLSTRSSPPATLLLRRRPGTLTQTVECGLEHGVVGLPRQPEWPLQPLSDIKENISRRARLEQRLHDGRCDAGHRNGRTRFRERIGPRFEERMIRKDEIREHARFVDEARKAHDIGRLFKRLTNLPGLRRREHWIRVVNDQHTQLLAARADSGRKFVERLSRSGRRTSHRNLRREIEAARLADGTEQFVERIHR